MINVPSVATEAEIALFINNLKTPSPPVNTQYAAMAYLGMCRHKYMSPDWLICQFAWEESIDNIHNDSAENAAQIKSRIEKHYQEKGYLPNA